MTEFCTPGELRAITGTSDRAKQVEYLSRVYGIHADLHGKRVVVYRDVVKRAQLGLPSNDDGVEMNLEALNA